MIKTLGCHPVEAFVPRMAMCYTVLENEWTGKFILSTVNPSQENWILWAMGIAEAKIQGEQISGSPKEILEDFWSGLFPGLFWNQ